MTSEHPFDFSTRNCSDLRPGDYIFIEDRPCRIIEITISPHKDNAVMIQGRDILNDETRNEEYRSNETMDIPLVQFTKCQLVSFNNFELRLRMPSGVVRSDIKVVEGIQLKLQELQAKHNAQAISVTVQSVMGEEAVIDAVVG
ncbi:hypothetical protein BO71DRAFT_488617 [Aspergillus ellipticus CBS 707.79]|uniref:Translation elongation factor IF5A C-terminal domain-containing protein n=1 Tax=Aspergillus ellipticus CBS 707.79 TaxID=1448320 RepID=A0A319DC45_9EURO|nr:hypothetical protein BO71DRAFT_488617 [Aspergillus ellipticus CBS 707.79]